jgi:MarR family transcriptional regulator, organic hydroperoxide resistance regulator
MKSKADLITEVDEIFKTMAHQRMHYQFEPWRKLVVPLAQLKSLFLIHMKESVSVHDLALDLGVTPGNVTSIIDRMIGQGLVTRSENPGDRRIVLLKLTDKGRDTIADIHETGRMHMTRVLDRMSREELVALVLGGKAFLKAMEQDYEEMNPQQNLKKIHAEMFSKTPVHSIHRKALNSA